MSRNGVRYTLIGADAFAAVSALAGAVMVVTGWPYQFPMSWLEGTPFSSYLIPGLILGLVVGGSATVAAIATIRRPDEGALASIIAGCVMAGWIVGEILILQRYTPLQAVYFVNGAVMVALGVWLAVGTGHHVAEVSS